MLVTRAKLMTRVERLQGQSLSDWLCAGFVVVCPVRQDRELRLSRKRNFATKVEISSKFRRNFAEINNRPWIRPSDDTQIPSRGVSQFGKISGISKNVEKIELFFAMSRESAFASKWVGDHRPRSTAS